MTSSRPRAIQRWLGLGLIVGGALLLGLSSIPYGNPALYSPAGGAAVVAGIAAVQERRGRLVALAIVAVAGSLLVWEWLVRSAQG